MPKQRLTITLDESTLDKIDQLIDHKKIRSRSHAIETVLQQHLQNNIDTALILAGGIDDSKNSVIKPLIKFKNKPLILHLLEHLKSQKVKRALILCNQCSDQIWDTIESFPGMELIVKEEKMPLGTAGAIKNAINQLPNLFYCLHSDIYTKINLQRLAEFHLQNRVLATIAVKPKMSHQSFDNVMVQGNQVVSFQPKDKKTNVSLVNSGIYVFNKAIIKHIPDENFSMLEKDVFPQLAKEGKVAAYSFQEEWLDVTSEGSYQKDTSTD